MKKISAKIVEKTWQEISAMSPSEAPTLITTMSKQQPDVLTYLMTAGHDMLSQDETELMLYMGIVIWKIMSHGDSALPHVTMEMIEEADRTNIELFAAMGRQGEEGFNDAISKMFETFNQIEIITHIMEAINEESGEGADIRDEMKGLIFLTLKTVVDCFDK